MTVLSDTEVHTDDRSVHCDLEDEAWVIGGVHFGFYRPASILLTLPGLELIDPTLLQLKRLVAVWLRTD